MNDRAGNSPGYSLGIDAGGTYTDAALYHSQEGVIASSKSLTTRHDLMIGIQQSLESLFENKSVETENIVLVSISTTLATNALVEGHGRPVCLMLIGQNERFLQRTGLKQALGNDPVVFIDGGHDANGDIRMPLDEQAIADNARKYAEQVSAFAVAGYFSVRNPSHENRSVDIIRATTGLPVTCSHELTSHLDAPRRALTTLLNARLIALLDELIRAVDRLLKHHAIRAPLMVVKGDGSLVSAEVAQQHPVETILSGPAASVVGALHLTQQQQAIISDIGGTTTDVAMVQDGQLRTCVNGAVVGGWKTMVDAIEIRTFGLGGDSEINFNPDGEIRLGPQRAVPLSLLAEDHPSVLQSLRNQQREIKLSPHGGRFAIKLLQQTAKRFTQLEKALWDAIGDSPFPVTELLQDMRLERPLQRLRNRGLIAIAAFTPSDAAHVLGLQDTWSEEAALLGADIMRLQWPRKSRRDRDDFCREVLEAMVRASTAALASTVLSADVDQKSTGADANFGTIVNRAAKSLNEQPGPLTFAMQLSLPIIAVGAPAKLYYESVAQRLRTQAIIPPFAEVCNAVGAVASGITERSRVLITSPKEKTYRVHAKETVKDFSELELAFTFAQQQAEETARTTVSASGGHGIKITSQRKDTIIKKDGQELFIESEIIVTAAARPPLATS